MRATRAPGPAQFKASPRPSGSAPSGTLPPRSLPLLDWETERSITLLELQRQALKRRIARLIPRSTLRIALEADLRRLTVQALRIEASKS